MIPATEVAWAAGFFEGEGSVMLLAHSQSRSLARLSVEVSQVDPDPLEWLRERWGGPIYTGAQRKRQRTYYRWIVTATQATAFLGDIQPYVLRPVVRARIELALAFQSQKVATWDNRTDAYHARQADFIAGMRHLNQRGAADLTDLERAVLAAREES